MTFDVSLRVAIQWPCRIVEMILNLNVETENQDLYNSASIVIPLYRW